MNGKLNIGIMQGSKKNREKYNICPKTGLKNL